MLHDTEQHPADVYLQTHATNPLLKTATVEAALRDFMASFPASCDSLFSVTRHQARFYDQHGCAINHDPAGTLLRTQDLPPIYEDNSSIYIFTRNGLVSLGSRIGRRPKMYEMNMIEAMDIDTEDEFNLAVAMASSML